VTSTEQNNSQKEQPVLYGLVLAGGKSVRMGNDKGAMLWHGKEQRYYMAHMLEQLCTEVYISCRAEQQDSISNHFKKIADNYEGAGPLIGILSAFKAYPQAAWLVVACDLPLLDLSTLEYLVHHRDKAIMATTFKSPHDGLPEPLITIWEPASFEVLKAHIAEGYSCPRKALIKNEQRVNMLTAPNTQALMNANTPEDAARVKGLIK
jgi:molybdopterin-guanine dinucleotide biosynthesis protein A